MNWRKRGSAKVGRIRPLHKRATRNGGRDMLCAELEKLEAEFDDILTALENPNLTEREKQDLRDAYVRMSRAIGDHQRSGHDGQPCFEE
jgi:hypothetical protein